MRGAPTPSILTTLWATFYATPFWWLTLGAQILILVLVQLVLGVFSLITTIFGAFMRAITSYRFLIAFAVIFVAFFFMRKYTPQEAL